jgi:hypothetical protein
MQRQTSTNQREAPRQDTDRSQQTPSQQNDIVTVAPFVAECPDVFQAAVAAYISPKWPAPL